MEPAGAGREAEGSKEHSSHSMALGRGLPRDHPGTVWGLPGDHTRPLTGSGSTGLERTLAFVQPVRLQSLLLEGTAVPVTPTFSEGRLPVSLLGTPQTTSCLHVSAPPGRASVSCHRSEAGPTTRRHQVIGLVYSSWIQLSGQSARVKQSNTKKIL